MRRTQFVSRGLAANNLRAATGACTSRSLYASSSSSTRLYTTSSAAKDFTNQLPSYDDEKYSRLDARRKKLLFRSRERGMLENDLILGTFALKNLENMNEQQLVQFEEILDCVDPDLFMWLTKKAPLPEALDNEVMHMIQKHTFDNPLDYDSISNRKRN